MSVTYSKRVAQRQKIARDLETVSQSFDDADADADKIFRTSKAQGLSLPKK